MRFRPPVTLLSWRRVAITGAMAAVVSPALVCAQEEQGWHGEVSLGLTARQGNVERESLELGVSLGFESESGDKLTITARGLQSDLTSTRRTAVRNAAGELVLAEDSRTIRDQEEYEAGLDFRRQFGPARLFWFGSLQWFRDIPGGVANRYSGVAGIGNNWINRKRRRFWSRYGYTVNREKRNDPEGLEQAADNYPGLRLEWELWWRISESSSFQNALVADQNLDDTADLRAKMTSGLSVAISDHFSLSVRFEQRYDDDPPVFTLIEQGCASDCDFLLVPREKLDSTLTTALTYQF